MEMTAAKRAALEGYRLYNVVFDTRACVAISSIDVAVNPCVEKSGFAASMIFLDLLSNELDTWADTILKTSSRAEDSCTPTHRTLFSHQYGSWGKATAGGGERGRDRCSA